MIRMPWRSSLLFLTVFLVHSLSRNIQSYDSAWSVHTALSIVRQGNADLDEYRSDVTRGRAYLYEIVNGHLYGVFPVGTPLLAALPVFVIDVGLRQFSSFSPSFRALLAKFSHDPVHCVDAVSLHGPVEVLVASLFVALASVLVYLIGRQSMDRSRALVLALIYAFCTSEWSTASRGLWQHGPSSLMLAAVLLIVLRARETPSAIQFVSIPLAFSFVIRPTNALSVVAFSVLVAASYRRYLVRYLIWGFAVACPFVIYNVVTYHALLPAYYLPQRVGSSVHLLEALAGNLFSPARGLVVYSPVFVLSVYGFIISFKVKEACDRVLAVIVFSVVIGHWVVISSFPHWYGGHSFGPRFFTDVVPYLVFLLIPVLRLASRPWSPTKVFSTAVFAVTATASLLIHLSGAMNPSTALWNGTPVDVDRDPLRVWDWGDVQFLRGIVRTRRHDETIFRRGAVPAGGSVLPSRPNSLIRRGVGSRESRDARSLGDAQFVVDVPPSSVRVSFLRRCDRVDSDGATRRRQVLEERRPGSRASGSLRA